MKEQSKIAWARLRRWFYLLTRGMYRGECAIDGFNSEGKLIVLATGPASWRAGEWATLHFWYGS